MRSRIPPAVALLVLLPATAHPRQTAEPDGSWPDEFLRSPIELREGVGTIHDPVTTSSTQARAFHEQGLALYYLFDYHDAIRSFHEALRHDPYLAVAHLGMSLAWERLGRPDAARGSLAAASALADRAGGAEQARIAVRVKLAAVRDGEASAEAFVSTLQEAVARFPDDAELRMELAMRSGELGVWIARLHELLEVSPEHVGAIHHLAHRYESAGDFEKAAELGIRIGEMAPSVPHGLQMAGYYLPRLGRAEEAVAWFEYADRVERRLIAEAGLPDSLFPNFRMNLHLLASTYWQVGRTEDSQRFFREFLELVGDPAGQTRATLVDMKALQGRSGDAVAAARRLVAEAVRGEASAPVAQAALASALIAAGDLDGARKELDAIDASGGPLGLPAETRVRRVEAQLLLLTGDPAAGAEALIAAATSAQEQASGLRWFPPLLELELLSASAAAFGVPELAARVAGLLEELDPAYVGAGGASALAENHGMKSSGPRGTGEGTP